MGLGIAGSEDVLPRAKPQGRQGQAATGGEGHRAAPAQGVHAPQPALFSGQDQAAIETPEHATEYPGDGDRQPADSPGQMQVQVPEVAVGPHDPQGDDAAEQHRGQHQAAEALFEHMGEFLDGEDHPTQGRIEGRGDAGGATGENQPGQRTPAVQAKALAEAIEQRGPDMHRGPFTTYRAAYQQSPRGKHHLAQGHGSTEQARAQIRLLALDAGDDLGNATAASLAQHPLGQPGQQGEAQRRDQPGPEGAVLQELLE